MDKSKICPQYCGVTCVTHCPLAEIDDYMERGMDVVHGCFECLDYKGCEDCAFNGDKMCIKNKESKK